MAAVAGWQVLPLTLHVPTCVAGGHVVVYVHWASGSGLRLHPAGTHVCVQVDGSGGIVTMFVQVCGPL